MGFFLFLKSNLKFTVGCARLSEKSMRLFWKFCKKKNEYVNNMLMDILNKFANLRHKI